MIRDLVHACLSAAVDALKSSGVLPSDVNVPIEVSDPKDPSHGDFACNFALAAAKQAGMNPRELGERLRDAVRNDGSRRTANGGGEEPPLFVSVDLAGPGFLNMRIADGRWAAGVDWANTRGAELPNPQNRQPDIPSLRLNIEFVSVNPNGPITVGSGRGAAFGSTLCNVLEAAGHEVHREYYINDGTNSEQMRLFALSVKADLYNFSFHAPESPQMSEDLATFVTSFFLHIGPSHADQPANWFAEEFERFRDYASTCDASTLNNLAVVRIPDLTEPIPNLAETIKVRYWLSISESLFAANRVEVPERGYRADYVREVAAVAAPEVLRLTEGLYSSFARNPMNWLQQASQNLMLESQRADLGCFATRFDTWFSEESLHHSGKVEEGIRHLIANGSADERPVRTVLKLAKGGKIDEVQIVEQPNEEVDEEETEIPGDRENDEKGEERKTTNEDSNPFDRSTVIPQDRNTLWLRSTKFGDDMDRVLRRKDGRLTYIASDVAYHKDKFQRGSPPSRKAGDVMDGAEGHRPREGATPSPQFAPADKLITILGPDHHGYISRLHAVLAALELGEGDERRIRNESSNELNDLDARIYASKEERDACRKALEKARRELEVIIFQIVRFVKDGKPAPMRKRDGNIYSLRDLMVEIGKDAAPHLSPDEQIVVGKDVARFFYLMRSHDTHMDFDIDLATKGTDENPVFYVQYAHARICSILKKAEEEKFDAPDSASSVTPQSSSRELHPKEIALIKKVLDLPWEVQRCAEDYGVHRLTTYAIELARTFHHFYDACRVIQPEEPQLTQRRLAICTATRHALQGSLRLLGVSAPEKMKRPDQNLEP